MFLFKNKYDRNSDIRYLKPAYILANNLGLVPCFDFENSKECHQKRYKLIAIFNCMIICIAYIQFLFKGIDEFMKDMSETELIVDNLEYFLITLFNLYSILGSFTYHRQSWIIFLKTFNDIDRSLCRKSPTDNKGSWFPLEFIIFNIFISFTFVFEMIIWFRFSVKPYIYYLCPRLELYYIFVTALIISLFSRSLLSRYKYFNRMLLKEHALLKNNDIDRAAICTLLEIKLNNILVLYRYLTRLIVCFNKVFGWVILIFNGVVIMACLECFNLMVLSLYVILNYHFYLLISLPIMMFTALLMAWGFFIIFICDKINKEAYKTSQICYQMLLLCNNTSNYTSRFEIFTEYCTYKCAQVTACTVFKLKRNLLLNFITVLTTYVIVIVSFSGKKLM